MADPNKVFILKPQTPNVVKVSKLSLSSKTTNTTNSRPKLCVLKVVPLKQQAPERLDQHKLGCDVAKPIRLPVKEPTVISQPIQSTKNVAISSIKVNCTNTGTPCTIVGSGQSKKNLKRLLNLEENSTPKPKNLPYAANQSTQSAPSNSDVHRVDVQPVLVQTPPLHAAGQPCSSSVLSSPVLSPSQINPPSKDLEVDAVNDTEVHSQILQDILPPNYAYKIVSVVPVVAYSNPKYDQRFLFSATVRVDIRSKEEALGWLEEYKTSSCTDWRVRRNFKENTQCLIFKKGFRCHHNTLAQYRQETKKGHEKQTECMGSLMITVKNFKMPRSSDELLSEYPCVLDIQHCHNHPLEAADSLRHRRPSDKVTEIFHNLFKSGHSPASALRTHQYDIQMEAGEEFYKVLGDGRECPNLQWCYFQYYKIFEQAYGAADGDAMLKSLSQAIEKYNSECGSVCAASKKFDDSDYLVVLCSPLMKRVHKYLKSSGEMAFIDSGGQMDRHNTRIFPILAPSVMGALPVGLILTSSESERIVTEGLEMLKSILPEDAFYGRGSKGPELIMTDDSTSEKNALHSAFPDATLLLCLFHILQAFWRYICDSAHKVKAEDRLEMLFQFKAWCKCETEEEFLAMYETLLSDSKFNSNSCVSKHIKDLFARSREWALCYRNELLTRRNNTNNYAESNIRELKDVVFSRVKAYSVVQMFDFLTTRLESYLERRISDVLNNRRYNYYKSKHYIRPHKLDSLSCFETGFSDLYVVKNGRNGNTYSVDMNLQVCTCPMGRNGGPCKHQFAVVTQYNLSSTQFLPIHDEEAKLHLHKIMTTSPPPPGWYASLKAGPATPGLADSIISEVASSEITETVPNQTNESVLTGPEQENLQGENSELENGGNAEGNNISDSALELWNEIDKTIRENLSQRPDTYGPAVSKFSTQFLKAKNLSENAFLSALHNFNSQCKGKRALQQGRNILVNRLSVLRRKTQLGGRTCVQPGRPPKTAFTNEHGYSVNKQKQPAWMLPKQATKRKALPHNLVFRAEQQSQKKSRTSLPK